MNNIQNILDVTFPLIEKLLKDYGEFYPLASFSRFDSTVEQLLDFDGSETKLPDPDTVISNLKKAFRLKKNELTALAIFKDVWMEEHELDAVVVFVEDREDESAYSLVYPYKLADGELEFFKPWKQLEEKEIFIE